MSITSKLPNVGTTIFATMSALALKHNAINLGQGFPDFDMSVTLRKMVEKAMGAGYNQYAPMPGIISLREEIANRMNPKYGISLDPENEITITSGGTQALFTALGAFVNNGDEVIIFEPSYDSYAPAIELFGGIVVPYKMQAPEYSIDWTLVKNMVNERTKLILVNTPNNPTGRVFTQEDWDGLSLAVEGTEVMIMSDEVYEYILFDERKHLTILNQPKLKDKAMVVYSFGKSFHNTGWKMGYFISNEEITREFRKVHQFNVFSANTPIQYALAEYMKTKEAYSDITEVFSEKRNQFKKVLEQTPFKVLPCEGTYFMLGDYSEFSEMDDQTFARWLTEEHKVATIPVSSFYSGNKKAESQNFDKVIRFCFGKKQETLDLASERLLNLSK
jgi:methionine transaminase